MATKQRLGSGWRKRLRDGFRVKELTLAQVAERMELAESTLRSWTNGNREPNLDDFFRLCAVTELDPQETLFGTAPKQAARAQAVMEPPATMTEAELAKAIKAAEGTESGEAAIALIRALTTKPAANKKVKKAFYGKNDPRKVARYSRPTLFNDDMTGPRKGG